MMMMGNSGLAGNVKNLGGQVLGDGLRVIGPARAGKLGGERCFRAAREGFLVIASDACSGPFPLLVWGMRW